MAFLLLLKLLPTLNDVLAEGRETSVCLTLAEPPAGERLSPGSRLFAAALFVAIRRRTLTAQPHAAMFSLFLGNDRAANIGFC